MSHNSTPSYAPHRNVYTGRQEVSPAGFKAASLNFPKLENSPDVYQGQNKSRYTDTMGYHTFKRVRKPQLCTVYGPKRNTKRGKPGNRTYSLWC